MRAAGTLLLGALLGAGVTAGAFLLAALRPDVSPAGDSGAASPAAPRGPGSSDATPDGSAAAGDSPAGSGVGLRSSAAPPTPAEREFLAAALREERRRRDAAAIRADDGGLEVLRKVFDEKAPVGPLLDFERVSSHVPRSAAGAIKPAGDKSVVKITAVSSLVIELGPGVFEFDWLRPPWDPSKPIEGLEIRGAGSAATTIRSPRTLVHAPRGVASLRFSGLTWEATEQGDKILDSRSDSAAVFEDCRFRAGERGSAFYLEGRNLLAFRRCTFESAPGSSTSLRLRGDTLVTFDACTFLDQQTVLYMDSGTVRDGAMRLVDCVFEGSRLIRDWTRYRGRTPIPIDVRGGRVLLGGASLSDDARRKAWGAEEVTTLDGTTFGPDPSRSTVGSLLAVLDGARLDDGAQPVGARVSALARDGRNPTWLVYGWNAASKKASVVLASFADGRYTIAPAPQSAQSHGHPSPPPGPVAFRTLVQGAGIPLDDDASGIVLQGWWQGGNPQPLCIHVEDPERWPHWWVDVDKGTALQRP